MPPKWRFWGSLLQYHVPYIHIARDSHLPFFLPFQADKHQKIRYRNAFAQISTYIHSFMLEDGIFTYIFFQALLRVCCVINAQPRTLPKNKIAWTNCWIHYHVTLLMVIALYYRNTWWQVSIILDLRRPHYSKSQIFVQKFFDNLSRGVLPENLRRGPYAVVDERCEFWYT